jgi:hypothetical protein
MPRICEFYGIAIFMYFQEPHLTPHFHVLYQGHAAVIAVGTLDVLAGSLPRRAMRLVREWALLHDDALRENWERCRERLPLRRIPPLQ